MSLLEGRGRRRRIDQKSSSRRGERYRVVDDVGGPSLSRLSAGGGDDDDDDDDGVRAWDDGLEGG